MEKNKENERKCKKNITLITYNKDIFAVIHPKHTQVILIIININLSQADLDLLLEKQWKNIYNPTPTEFINCILMHCWF